MRDSRSETIERHDPPCENEHTHGSKSCASWFALVSGLAADRTTWKHIVLDNLGVNRTVFLQQGHPTCFENATGILVTSSGASGTVETQVTLDAPGQVGFRVTTTAPASSDCVLVNVVAPVPPMLTVNGGADPVTATEGEPLIALVTGLTPNGGLTAYLYRDASTCDGTPTEEAGGTADPSGQWGEQRSVKVGTLAIAVRDGATSLLSNCVAVTGQALPTATATATATVEPTATPTATATPPATPTETPAPSEAPTATPTDPAMPTIPSTSTASLAPDVAVTTLPATGQDPATPGNPVLLLLLLAAAGLLFGAGISLRSHQRRTIDLEPPSPPR